MSTRRPFAPVERATISERVRDELHGRILTGELPPGHPVPAERVLAEQFGVARTSVREAMQGLIALGVVVRRGNRSFVAEQVPGAAAPPAEAGRRSLRGLLEAWRVIELCVIELAVSRATIRERREVGESVTGPAPTTLEAFCIADRAFHAGLGAACGNPVLAEFHRRVIDTLLESEGAGAIVVGVTGSGSPRRALAAAHEEHRAIAAAFAAGSVEDVLAAADRHLGHVYGRIPHVARRLAPAAGRPVRAARRTVGM